MNMGIQMTFLAFFEKVIFRIIHIFSNKRFIGSKHNS